MPGETKETTKLHVVDFIKIWYLYDLDRNGYIEGDELKPLAMDIMQKTGEENLNVDGYLANIMKQNDLNCDKKLELKEVARLFPIEDNFLNQFMYNDDMKQTDFEKVWLHYDSDQNGFIEAEEVMAILRDLKLTQGEEPTTTGLEGYKDFILQCCDENGDGKIEKKELRLLLIG